MLTTHSRAGFAWHEAEAADAPRAGSRWRLAEFSPRSVEPPVGCDSRGRDLRSSSRSRVATQSEPRAERDRQRGVQIADLACLRDRVPSVVMYACEHRSGLPQRDGHCDAPRD
jgi:hypothetical protein